ncbi:putative proteinC DOMAIN-CONTAINING PROTEIN 73 [Salix viminalis]|uniref:NAC domain-containing protein n=1 Tax=Salix viminalis TaxID=40686 RepID=A0A9Q0NXA0_SALVM|nr:putative proteinC DOMAIN-CONTAINING PROTEIN 73 [Salix viminalis]
MTWCNGVCKNVQTIERSSPPPCNANTVLAQEHKECLIRSCPSCGHQMRCRDQARIHDLPGLPAGVKFDPTDLELLEHLEGKVLKSDTCKVHPLIDEFIPTIDGENGICYTHPEKLPEAAIVEDRKFFMILDSMRTITMTSFTYSSPLKHQPKTLGYSTCH